MARRRGQARADSFDLDVLLIVKNDANALKRRCDGSVIPARCKDGRLAIYFRVQLKKNGKAEKKRLKLS